MPDYDLLDEFDRDGEHVTIVRDPITGEILRLTEDKFGNSKLEVIL